MQEKGRLISMQTIEESAILTLQRTLISSSFATRSFRLSMRSLQTVRESFQRMGYAIPSSCYLCPFEAIPFEFFVCSSSLPWLVLVVSLGSCLALWNQFERSITFLSRVEGCKPTKGQSAPFSLN